MSGQAGAGGGGGGVFKGQRKGGRDNALADLLPFTIMKPSVIQTMVLCSWCASHCRACLLSVSPPAFSYIILSS